MNICACISGPTMKKALLQIMEANKKANFIELRLDLIKAFNAEKLFNKAQKPVIMTMKGKSENAFQSIKTLLDLKPDFIDIDLSLGKEKIRKIMQKNKHSKVIISIHDFNKTPSLKKLEKIQQEMLELNPDVMKIISAAKNKKDNEKIIRFLAGSRHKKKLICFCMGSKGIITRRISATLGFDLFYTSTGKKTAEGQILLEEARKLKEMIQG